MMMEEPRTSIRWFFLKRVRVRVMVSRVEPMRLASSSWVRAMVKRISVCCPQAEAARPHSSRMLASRPAAEPERARRRASRKVDL